MKLTYKNSQSKIFETNKGVTLRFLKPFLTVCLLLFIVLNSWAQNAPVSFTFSLGSACKTSGGVYKKNGTLIRTLWGGVTYSAGTHTKTWDRKDDEGHLVTDTGMVVKVLSNNVNYLWEGVIGNTSDSTHGISVINSYYRMEGMAIYGNNAYYATGYSEGTTPTNKILLNKPQNKIPIMYQQYGTNLAISYLATDRNYVYWTGLDPFGGSYQSTSPVSLTYATKVSDDAEVLFSAGKPVQMGTGRKYPKAIDTIMNNSVGDPTGIAVQKLGKYLFVAHGGLNKIHILNKTSGAAVTSFSITNPREICIDGNDNLWIVSGTNTVARYSVDSATGTIASSASLTLSSLLQPLGLAVSPNNYQILVLDGGASQQVKSFSNISGDSLWTYGQHGGYEYDPAVSNDKFYFTDTVSHFKQFIAFQPDSSFWVSDGGNERVMHFSPSRTFIDHIMHLPATYTVQVDRNDPTRAFNQFMEFKIDYSKPLSPSNGSWKLVRNWRHGVPKAYINVGYIADVFQNVLTLSNGRTYATLTDMKSVYGYYPEIVELPDSGHVRFTGVKFSAYSSDVIETDGSRRSYSSANGSGTDTGFWKTKSLKGFDNNNNPTWNSDIKIATINSVEPKDPSYDPIYGTISYPVKTTSDVLVIFNHSLKDGYHLGGVKVGDNKFLWKTALSTFKESSPGAYDQYKGEFPSDGSYDIGNDVKIGGGNVYTIDKNIFWNYHGEFWGGGQTNKWNHVYDNGLLVSQFGITTQDARLSDWDAPAELAGNVFSATVVKVGNDFYVYHNDEAVHSGLHRWKITGLSTIQEQTLTLNYSVTNGGLTASYFDGKNLNSFNRKTTRVDTTVNNNSIPSSISNVTNVSTRWNGFIQPAYSQSYTFYTTVSNGVRLWVNGKLLINQWNGATPTAYTSSSIVLEAGKKYTIKMEINGGTATFSWSSTSQSKQIIPSSALFPAEFPDYIANGTDLMEGLGYRTVLEDGMYGWNRNPVNEENSSSLSWHAQTSMRSFEKSNPDILIDFSSSSKTASVTRDLGKAVPCLTSWTINGNISFKGNEPNFLNTNFGGFFDILDSNGKIISRITNEREWTGKNPTSIKMNGVEIAKEPASVMTIITNKLQPFEIKSDSTGIIFKYAGYSAKKVKLFDSTSNWKQPATLKFHFTYSSTYSNYTKIIDVQKMKFFATAPSIPDISVGGVSTFCQGDSVRLTSTIASSYLWSNGATTQAIQAKAAGNYVVKVKDGKGCMLPSDTIKVKVNALPIPVITASRSTTMCAGDSVILTSSIAKSYLWNNNDTNASIKVKTAGSYNVKVKSLQGCSGVSNSTVVSVANYPIAKITASGPTTFCSGGSVVLTADTAKTYLWSNSATTRSITASLTGSYSVKVTNAGGCSATSNSTSVNANGSPATPTISASRSTALCTGDSVILTSSTASAYAWSNGATSQSIVVKTAGSYTVTISNGVGCSATSTSTSVTSNSNPATPSISASGSTTFCQGDSVTLTASSANAYLWNNGATTQSVKVKGSGNFSVKITDNNSCSNTSTSTSVTVNALPSASITASGSTTFCQGDSVTLTATAANAYLWNNGATIQSVKVKASGNFLVKITDNNSCSNTSTATSVTVNALPSVTITANGAQTFCDGDSVILTATAANAYLWNNGEQTANIKIKISGLYNVTVTDQNSCSATSSNNIVHVNPLPMATITANGSTTFCEGDSVTLTSSSAKSFLWNSKATTASIVVKNSGQFDVFITDVNGCSSKSNITLVQVNQLPLAEITLQQSPVLCDGDSVILTANVGQAYLWNTGVTTQQLIAKKSGLYNVIVTDGMGCSATARNIKVLINKPIVPIVIPLSSTTFCQGDSVILKSSNAKQYIWNSLAVNASVVVKSSVIMVVTTVDSNGCTASSLPTTVKVNTLPARPTIATNKSPEICVGDSVKLSVGTYNAYVWNNMSTKPEINIGDAGNYSVLVTDKNGCKAISYPLTIKVNSLPKVLITPDGPTTFCEGESVVLSANVSNTYLWNNNEEVQNILVDAPGIYTVTITDYKQCSNTSDPIIVVVNPLPKTPIITVSQNTLTCSVKINVQWYLNGTEIPGATKPQYTMTENGDYTVRISNGTCTVFSESFICKSFKSTNSLAINKVSSTNVFPNPTIGPLTIQLENAIGTQILITNAEGKMIYNAAYSEQIDLTGNAMGVYFITVISTQGKSTHKITLMN